jgi:hypothetical protein
MFLSLNSQHIIHLPNITHPQSIKNRICSLTPLLTIMVFPSAKTFINGHGKHPNGGPLVSPSSQITTLKNVQLSANPSRPHKRAPPSSNTRHTLDLVHPAVKRQFCQRYILLQKSPKARTMGRQSTDHICNMIQMIETMKGIFLSIKRHDAVSIAIGYFEDMDRLPDFYKMADHPALLVPQKIPVDEDAILPYFPKPTEAILGDSMRHHFSWNTTFSFMNSKLMLHCIFGHTLPTYLPINWTPMTSHMIHFVTLKYSPKSVCQNLPRKIIAPVCLPWRTIYLTVCLMTRKISLKPCIHLWTTFLRIIIFTNCQIIVITCSHCTIA